MSAGIVSLAEARQRREQRLALGAEQLVSKKLLADHFAVSVRTVERWVERGCPVAQRLWGGSGAPRFHISAVADWHARQA